MYLEDYGLVFSCAEMGHSGARFEDFIEVAANKPAKSQSSAHYLSINMRYRGILLTGWLFKLSPSQTDWSVQTSLHSLERLKEADLFTKMKNEFGYEFLVGDYITMGRHIDVSK